MGRYGGVGGDDPWQRIHDAYNKIEQAHKTSTEAKSQLESHMAGSSARFQTIQEAAQFIAEWDRRLPGFVVRVKALEGRIVGQGPEGWHRRVHDLYAKMMDVSKIEARIDLERKRDADPSQPAPSWDGYRMERNPLEAGLAEFAITLQKTDVPQRIKDRQNVLFLGNVLNHYPQEEQARELDRVAANMEEGDIVIVQVDEVETGFIEVLQVRGQGAQKARERVRWINTKKLEVQKPVRGPGSWRQIRVKPEVERMVSRLIECLGRKVSSPEWSQKNHRVLVHQYISHVFGTVFRALPGEETIRIAIREAVRRLPSEGGSKGIPVFKDDAKDAYGGALETGASPIVTEADFIHIIVTCGMSSQALHSRTPR